MKGHTGIELKAANTIRNLPNPPAGSKAIFKGPPTPYARYACFQAALAWTPEYSAAPSVCTRTVGTTIDVSQDHPLSFEINSQIPAYVAQKILYLGVLAGIFTL
jgi:hypothetical protein